MKKNIRGYGLNIALSAFRKQLNVDINPLVFNKLLICKSSKIMGGGYHIVFGPLHFWTMETRSLIGIELDCSYNYFWWDKPQAPSNYELIYPQKH